MIEQSIYFLEEAHHGIPPNISNSEESTPAAGAAPESA